MRNRYFTCEHCGRRVPRGEHFVCRGLLVTGDRDELRAELDRVDYPQNGQPSITARQAADYADRELEQFAADRAKAAR